MALCDTAFKVEKSATCEQLEGTLPHGCTVERPSVRPKLKWMQEEWAWCMGEVWGEVVVEGPWSDCNSFWDLVARVLIAA